jgi:putative mRNA 3-end processing factor
MEIRFLGGASQVGSLGMVLKGAGGTLLFDYGMTPTDPPAYPAPAPPVDDIFLTHAHIDHSGMIPRAASVSDCHVHATALTAEVSGILLKDSLKIARMEGYAEPFSDEELRRGLESFTGMEPGGQVEAGGLTVESHRAGHIPGASMYTVDDGSRTALFTGDINTIDTNLVERCRPVECNTLVLESTYAGREHEARKKIEHALLEKVEDVVDRGGLAVVPAFAVGRTQEVLMLLAKSGLEVWVDGMGKLVTEIYLDHPGYLADPRGLKRAIGKVNKVRSPMSRERAMKGDVVITTSGMLDGGPALDYIKTIRKDTRSAILLTGYQVEGTNGRRLMEEGMLDFFGVLQEVKTEVGFFDLSAHAGHSELVKFAQSCNPEKVVLCHGDNREELASALADGFEVLMPVEGEGLEI